MNQNLTSESKRIAVVFPVHNRRELTLQCLRSLARVESKGLELFVVLVDDGSTDGTSEAVLKEFPDTNIVKGDGNLWYTAGINRGIEKALEIGVDFVLTINDDEIFDDKFLRLMLDTAVSNPRSIVGAALLLWDQPHRVFQVAPEWGIRWGGFRHWVQQTVWTLPSQPFEVDLIVGNCVLFPIEAIRECGLMNESLFKHYGDAEYTPRMKRAGWRLLIEPRARVFCQPNAIPPRIRRMGTIELLRSVLVDPESPHSLRRRVNAAVHGGPGTIQGFVAVAVFFVRLALGKNLEGTYAQKVVEPQLKVRYRDRTIG
ncbi:MAG: glycosyltransferase family 2 protein [Pyrinomonadaceae bacterium]